jgi:hypothetical protein
MLRKLLLWIVAVIGLVAVSQSASAQVIARSTSIGILFEVAEGATRGRGDQLECDRSAGAAARQLRKHRQRAIPRPRCCFTECLPPRRYKLRDAIYRADIHTSKGALPCIAIGCSKLSYL